MTSQIQNIWQLHVYLKGEEANHETSSRLRPQGGHKHRTASVCSLFHPRRPPGEIDRNVDLTDKFSRHTWTAYGRSQELYINFLAGHSGKGNVLTAWRDFLFLRDMNEARPSLLPANLYYHQCLFLSLKGYQNARPRVLQYSTIVTK